MPLEYEHFATLNHDKFPTAQDFPMLFNNNSSPIVYVLSAPPPSRADGFHIKEIETELNLHLTNYKYVN